MSVRIFRLNFVRLQACALLVSALAGVAPLAAESEARLLRYPAIHRDFVVFVYAGDLWRAASAGGRADRLTTHEGVELTPKISPDGEWVAYSAEYTGSRQVYVMPATGGEPKQLTFYNDVGVMPPRGGFDYWIQGWSAGRQDPGAHEPHAVGRAPRALLPGRSGGRARAPSADPRRRQRLVLTRRQVSGLHLLRSRVPHLEALPRRPQPGHLDLRPRSRRVPASDRLGRAPTTSRCGTATRSTSPPTASRR